jgi:putative heme-binding domain-containing protein
MSFTFLLSHPKIVSRFLTPFLCVTLLSSVNAKDEGYKIDADTKITILDGFDADLVYSVPKSQGSWVAMAFDPKGRLIVSDQDDKGVFRVTLPEVGEADAKVEVESLKGFPYLPIDWGQRKVGGALGFLYAFDSLYMSSMKGFYRIRDTDGDDKFDEFTLLKKLNPGYEHSAHSVILTEDGKGLYLISGNYTRVPEGTASLQPPVWKTDDLIPAMPDPMGHAVGLMPPGGWICRISPDGKDWKMISSGYRNAVDLAINREGELFTFDSDLEFDVGAPWYRPTRVNHVTSASEFGWRNGSGKWPEYYADSLGAVINVGPGSPTGISFGHHSNYPAQFQDKLFVCDWTFGTIYTVEMEESGSSYTGTKKEFLHGSPLSISAMRFGPDGHMYFLTGGRNLESKLYRIRYTGEKSTGESRQLLKNKELRDLRKSLEIYHGSNSGGADAIEKSWQYLSHDDRNIRYAARLAIECQDLALWKDKVLAETNPRAVIYGSIALCRHGEPTLTGKVLEKLGTLTYDTLKSEDRLALLRAYSLCFLRLDKPTPDQTASAIAKLDPQFPAKDRDENTELCRVLCALNAPQVVAKTIDLMKKTQSETTAYDDKMLERSEYGQDILKMMQNTPNTQNIFYAYALRQVTNGWSIEQRKYFFSWLNESLEKNGGKSFAGYINAIRNDAIDHLPHEVAAEISDLLGEIKTLDLSKLPKAKGPAVAWTVDSAMKLFEKDLKGRNFENGKKMFSAGTCVACHRFEGTGGVTGPDLGSIGRRFSVHDMLESIIDPNKTISEQYQASSVKLKNGKLLYGRVISKNDKEIAVAQDAYNFRKLTKEPIENVDKIEISQTSLMPPATIFTMNQDELMDLIAYLKSGGNPKDPAFEK